MDRAGRRISVTPAEVCTWTKSVHIKKISVHLLYGADLPVLMPWFDRILSGNTRALTTPQLAVPMTLRAALGQSDGKGLRT